jgi:hypothetical protein
LRGLLWWAWIAGILAASHTWFLSDLLLEASSLPAYLVLVILVGSVAWGLLDAKNTQFPLLIFLTVGWILSFLFDHLSSSENTLGNDATALCRGVIISLWAVLLMVYCLWGRRIATNRMSEEGKAKPGQC